LTSLMVVLFEFDSAELRILAFLVKDDRMKLRRGT
jgi:hypothetical protein